MLHFAEITDANDELLQKWLDLYETAFPPEERVLVSSFLWLLNEKRAGNRPHSHIQAVLDETSSFVALLRFDLGKEPGIAYLWYLAVDPEARGGGVGSECFREVVRRAEEAKLRAVVFEVEVPEHFGDPARRENARRRIEFYRRQGAKVLTGIHYIQRISNQPEIPMHILVRPIEAITAGEAFEMARLLFDDVTQIGELDTLLALPRIRAGHSRIQPVEVAGIVVEPQMRALADLDQAQTRVRHAH